MMQAGSVLACAFAVCCRVVVASPNPIETDLDDPQDANTIQYAIYRTGGFFTGSPLQSYGIAVKKIEIALNSGLSK